MPASPPVATAVTPGVVMKDGMMRTLRVPLVTAKNAAPIYIVAGLVPVRMVIRNIGAANVFLAYDVSGATSGTGAPGSDSSVLPPQQERVLILAPKQTLYATSLVVGRVTITVSDALPIL